MAPAAKKPPLKSSSSHNSAAGDAAGKTIEEMYQKKTQLEHILLRPDTYVGSIEKHTATLWVYEDGAMVNRSVTYVPGLYKIFDEILVNAADNKQRDPSMDSLKVDIDVAGCCISIYNNGDGVPVDIHQEEGMYVPELIFGHLLTSSNYDDNERKTTVGRHGYGAKLASIFSTEFVIETADGRRQKKYKQLFSENMGKKLVPEIQKCNKSENWTKVTFKPDLAKFNMTELEADVVALMMKRVVDMAGTLGKTVKVELNGEKVAVKSFSDYVQLYIDSASKEGIKLPRIYQKVNDRWEVCVSLSEGQFQQVSFVNGIATIKGGTHVDLVANQIASHVMRVVNKKNKQANMKLHIVKGYLWVFVNALIDNPAFDSQTKETLTTRQGSFGSTCELPDDFLKKVSTSGVVESLLSWANKRAKNSENAKDSKPAAKRQPKKAAAKSQKANLAGSDDDYEEKPAAQKKKPPPKKACAPVKDEEDEVADLKDRLAASNINGISPEPSAMETEEQKGNKGRNRPSKRGAAKKAMSSLAEISDEDVAEPHHESDDGGSSMEVEKKTKGRKPAAEKPAQSKGMRQKVTEEIFKPTDKSNLSAPSPEKKVRRIRGSPFNKKSGSVLHRMATTSTGTEDAEAPPSGSSAEPVAPRRTTRERKAVVYVASGSEDDESEDEDVSEPSDDDESGSEDDGVTTCAAMEVAAITKGLDLSDLEVAAIKFVQKQLVLDAERVIVCIGQIELICSKMASLIRPVNENGVEKWLYDDIINLYATMFNSLWAKESVKYALSTFDSKFLIDVGKEWLTHGKFIRKPKRRANELCRTLIRHEMVPVPMNTDEEHWWLVVINLAKQEWQILDSYDMKLDYYVKVTWQLRNGVHSILQSFSSSMESRWSNLDVMSWPVVVVKEIPRQDDICSCGIFTIKYMKYWNGSELTASFSQEHMETFRKKMPSEILLSSLNKSSVVVKEVRDMADV